MDSSNKTEAQIDALNEKTAQMQNAIAKLEAQTQQVSSFHNFSFQISFTHFFLSQTDDDWNWLDDEGYGAC